VVGAESAALPEEKLVIEDAVRSHAWIFDALGELVAATPSTPRRPQREDVRRALRPRFVWLRRQVITYRGISTRHLG
jgi:hypothetical protein